MVSNSNSSNPVLASGALEGMDLSSLGPGHSLRDARKAINLDQADVAQQLNLTLVVVNSLERDEYEDMPPPVFVRGYLRSYALIVGLNPGEMVAMYDGLVGEDRSQDLFRAAPVVSPSTSQKALAPMVAIGVAVVLIAAGIWAWQSGALESLTDSSSDERGAPAVEQATINSQHNESDAMVEDGSDTMASLQSEAAAVGTVQQEAGVKPEGIISAVAPVIAEPVAVDLDETNGADIGAPTDVRQIIDDVEPVASASVESAFNGDVADGMPVVEPVEIPASLESTIDSAEVVVLGQGVLNLVFTDNCWTDVADASGKKLLYGVMKAGMVRNVTGETPFKITLGQADAVIVKYNGELFDHQAFSQGKIARFVVGQAAE